jgi:hypothetical protein
MPMGRTSSFLGVAVSDRSATCAEVVAHGGDRRSVRRTATFVFPEGVMLDSPDALGQALAGFLRQRRFTASRAVVGVPARWLIAMEKEVPPSDDQQARAMLRLQAERLAVAESGEVVFDFAGRTSASSVSKVLLVGMVRERLARVEQMMDAAGMTVAAITSTGLTLAAAATRAKGSENTARGVLMLSKNGGEVVWRHDGSPRMLRPVSFLMNGHGLPPIAPLGAELHRAVALAAANGDAGGELLLLDGVGLPREHVQQLSQRLGVEVRAEDGVAAMKIQVEPGAMSETEADEPATVGRFAPAVSLALAAARPELLPLDFRHSRLTPAPPKRFSRAQIWGVAIGATVVIALAGLFFAVRARESELADLTTQLEGMKDQIKTAQTNVDRFKYGRGYFETRPPILDCLRDLAAAFGEGERIWVNNVTYREGNRFSVSGKAADTKIALAIIDRVRANPRFADVKNGPIVEADPRTREVSYSFSFEFNPPVE